MYLPPWSVEFNEKKLILLDSFIEIVIVEQKYAFVSLIAINDLFFLFFFHLSIIKYEVKF